MDNRHIYALAGVAVAILFLFAGCDCSDNADTGDGGSADGPRYWDATGHPDGGTHPDGGDVGHDGGGDAGPVCGDVGHCKRSEDCRCGVCKPHWCTKDDDCNPGQICTAKICRDSFLQCSGTECDVEGQKCSSQGGTNSCHYDPCDAQGKCPAGLSCFNTYCVSGVPCNGKCLDTQVCLTDRNECIPAPAGCDVKCDDGQLRVFKDPSKGTYSTCEAIECACEYLPNIPVGEYGHYCSVTVKGGDAYASAYSATYGDLVVTKFAFDDQAHPEVGGADPTTAEFVDGVPTTGKLTGNPKGPRGGIADPGPNVGKYTSIALGGDGNLAVAYYDVDNGDLKYARHDGTKWTTHVVDGADGSDVGLYAALAFASDGKPHVAYFQKTGAPGGADYLKGALKLAIGKTGAPASSSDWTVITVDSAPITCRGLCPKDNACIEQAPLTACVPVQTDCNPACDKQVCIHDANNAPVCVDEQTNPAPELFDGTGLFPSLVAASDGNDYIAYYDHAPVDLKTFKGNLKTAVVAGGMPTIAIQDGEDAQGTDTGDVGRFASLAQASGGEFGIAYYDATYNQLKYWHGTIGQPATIEIVQTGVTPGLKEFVGPDCSLAFDTNGVPHIAFQNATDHTLVYAVRDAGGGGDGGPDAWPAANITVLLDPTDANLQKRFGTGGYGFFARQKLDATTSYIVNLKVGFTNPDQPTPDNKLILYKKKF